VGERYGGTRPQRKDKAPGGSRETIGRGSVSQIPAPNKVRPVGLGPKTSKNDIGKGLGGSFSDAEIKNLILSRLQSGGADKGPKL